MEQKEIDEALKITWQERDDLRQMHKGWLHNPNTSRGQLQDSKTILNLLDNIDDLRAECERLKDNLNCVGVHTCHEECQNPMCLMRKENEQLKKERETWGNEFSAVCALKEQLQTANAEIERLKAEGVHSCHDACQKPACVLRRELQTAQAENAGLRTALECALGAMLADQKTEPLEARQRYIEQANKALSTLQPNLVLERMKKLEAMADAAFIYRKKHKYDDKEGALLEFNQLIDAIDKALDCEAP